MVNLIHGFSITKVLKAELGLYIPWLALMEFYYLSSCVTATEDFEYFRHESFTVFAIPPLIYLHYDCTDSPQ